MQMMQIDKHKIFLILICLLVLVNLGVFIYSFTIPINWWQFEMLWTGLHWSMDGPKDYHLHLGFRSSELIKIFDTRLADWTFRNRHVSYFLEMISFKVSQYYEKSFFGNNTIAGLHILNVFLLWYLIYKITKEKRPAAITALLFLNSGAALATLLFPFRNAKILVMTFFLLDWIIVAGSKGKFCESSPSRIIGFFVILFLASFTDEYAFFIFPLIFIFMFLRDGFQGILNRRIISGIIITVILFGITYCALMQIALKLSDSKLGTDWPVRFFRNLMPYFSDIHTARDIMISFFNYFLRRNFGYWDLSPWGILSAASFILIMGLIVTSRKPLSLEGRTCLAIGIIFILKLILLPNVKVHDIFMPASTKFPSLLFFSYYYVYCEAMLVSLAIGFYLKNSISFDRRYTLSLIAITVIAVSNIVHLKNGPEDALKFHGFYNTEKQNIARNIFRLGHLILTKKDSYPIYLSFPGVDSSILNDEFRSSPPDLYGRLIVLRYLRSIAEGKIIIPYKNTETLKSWPTDHELSAAKYFYDVNTREMLDLETLRANVSNEDLTPKKIVGLAGKNLMMRYDFNKTVEHAIFFIKGKAKIQFISNNQTITRDQNYGEVYQMFKVDLKSKMKQYPAVISMNLIPYGSNKTVYLIGPIFSQSTKEVPFP